jgi:2-methylisocitrate lyase-like PEP mutase family enzyme
MSSTQRLKGILARRAAVALPGAADAMFARVIEGLGFEAVYVGAGVVKMHLGASNVGLMAMTEVAEVIARSRMQFPYRSLSIPPRALETRST